MYKDRPLSVNEAADYLSVKPATIYNLVHYGKLPAYKGGGKMLRFKLADLEAYAYGRPVGNYSQRAESVLNKPRKRRSAG